MNDLFPRTTVGGVSVPRMIVGTNWFLGATHRSAAKDKFIRSYQTSENIADILVASVERGIDAIYGWPTPTAAAGVREAQERTGFQCTPRGQRGHGTGANVRSVQRA